MNRMKHDPSMLKCPKCGAVVQDELGDYCEKCGADLDEPVEK